MDQNKNENENQEMFNNTAHDIGFLFKYFKLSLIFAITCVMMYIPNLEFMGTILGAAFNEFIITYIAMDYSESPKHMDIIIFVLELVLKFKILGEFLVFMIVIDLQRKYTNIGSPIQLSRDSRIKFDTYKRIFVVNTILLLVISFILFTSYPDPKDNKKYLDFFYSFSVIENFIKFKVPIDNNNPDIIMKTELEVLRNFYRVINYGWYCVKIILVLSLLYTTALMNIVAEEIVSANTARLYIMDTTNSSSENSTPHKTGSFSGFMSTMFSNINLNYLMNYN